MEASNQIATGSPAQHRVVGAEPCNSLHSLHASIFCRFQWLTAKQASTAFTTKTAYRSGGNRYSSCRLGLDVH